ncbi:titin homolog [Montipora foliosa]|uniref:titin homolog n=1 Tax=Montipora foliosa TaxID=591990 RepID=UPI0035F21113
MRISERIQSLQRASYAESRSSALKSRRSVTSKSSTRKSSLRCVSLARADAAAKAEKAKIEMEFLERKTELERFRLEKQYALAKAEEDDALRGILDEESKPVVQIKRKTTRDERFKSSPDETTVPETVKSETNRKSPPFVPKASPEALRTQTSTQNREQFSNTNLALNQLISLLARQTELSSLFINQQKTFHLPVKEPPTFSGDSFEYPAFVTAFDSIIAAKVSAEKDKLFFLEKYTSGKANEAIKGFLATNSDTAYTEARKLLDQRFGNPVVVSEDYKKRLRNWRQINEGDSKGLREFSDFLIRCEEAMKSMKSMSELDSTQILQSISAKLPSYSGVKWCRFTHEVQSKDKKLVGFKDFANFVKQEAELANDAIFSPDVLKRERKKNGPPRDNNRLSKTKPQGGPDPSQSFVTSANLAKRSEQKQQPPTRVRLPPCPICENKHFIAKCATFNKATADERFEMLKKLHLCFSCFKTNHVSSECRSRSTCDKCSKQHHTLLHGTTPKQSPSTGPPRGPPEQPQPPSADESAHSNATSTVKSSAGVLSSATTCRTVPVVLYHKDNPSNEVKTYALLDDASDTTFITNKLKSEIGIEGVSTSLNLSTMHGREVVPVSLVDGLVVERPDRRAKVDLPKAYARDSIPSRKDQIALRQSSREKLWLEEAETPMQYELSLDGV